MSGNPPSFLTTLGIAATFILASAATTARAQTGVSGKTTDGITCPSAVKGPEARAAGARVSVPVRDKQIQMDMFYRREGTKLFGSGYATDGSGPSIATKGDITPRGVRLYEVHLEIGVAQLTFDPRNPANFSTNDEALQTAPAGERQTKFSRIVDALQRSEDAAAKAIEDKCGAPEITDNPASAPAPEATSPAGGTGTPAGGGAPQVTWRADGPLVKEGSITTTFSRYTIEMHDAANGNQTILHLVPMQGGGLQTQTIGFSSPNFGLELYNPRTGIYNPSTAEVRRGARPGSSPGGPPQGMAANIAPYIQAAHHAIDAAKGSSGGGTWNDEPFRNVLNKFAPEANPPGTVKKQLPDHRPNQ